jgi:hypothetical protein
VNEEPDGLGLAVDVEAELDLEGKVGGDALALPDAHVLLDDALHALDVEVGRLDDVVDAERGRDAHAPADLGRRRGLLRGHVVRGHLAAERDLDAREAARRRAEAAERRRPAREAAAQEERGGGGGRRRHGRGGGRHLAGEEGRRVLGLLLLAGGGWGGVGSNRWWDEERIEAGQ